MTYSLVRDFGISESPHRDSISKKPFVRGFANVRGKRVPCLFQKEPGELQYFYKLQKNPVLRVATYSVASSSQFRANVNVESDDGVAKSYEVAPKASPSDLDLSPFENKIVRITLAATPLRKRESYKKFYWLDPVIVQDAVNHQYAALREEMQQIRARQENHNVIIALFDAANPMHFGCYGYHRDTSPNIDALAAEGVLFENAISQAAHTLASTGTLFTGLYPEGHGVLWRPRTLDLRYKTLAEAFTEIGYRTFMGSCNPNASPIIGYGQGFQDVWSPRTGRLLVAPQLSGAFLKWLDNNPSQSKPFFAYLHYREPHKPYMPPDFYRKRFEPEEPRPLPRGPVEATPPASMRNRIEAAYDANMAHADAQFGRVLQHLKQLQLIDNTIIIILADHGEGFWEHGKQGHNIPVYEEIIRIPMIIRMPGESHLKGIRRREAVGSIDIYPTLADLFDFSQRGVRLQGQSLLPLLTSKSRWSERHVMSQSVRKLMFTVRSQDLKYILDYRFNHIRGELYDLARDPKERKDLSRKHPILASYLRSQIIKIRSDANKKRIQLAPGKVKEVELDPETLEELRALGYVGRN